MRLTKDQQQTSVWIVFTHALLPNGAAHRLVGWLRSMGHEAVLASFPMPGANHFRLELDLTGSKRLQILKDAERKVSQAQYLANPIQAIVWAKHLRRYKNSRVFLIGCDPLAFLIGGYALTLAGVNTKKSVVYFVDWSAQRLDRVISAKAYRTISRLAMHRADHVKAISAFASDALVMLNNGTKVTHDIEVIPNIPLTPAHNFPIWESREPRLVYFGSITKEHGARLLPEIASALHGYGLAGYHLDIAGDGPQLSFLRDRLYGLNSVTVHGTIERSDSLMEIAQSARVGLALYDPSYPQFANIDSLKIKDYLSAGLRVVTTLPASVDDGVIIKTDYSVDSIVTSLMAALTVSPPFPPEAHPILKHGETALKRLVQQVMTGQD